MAAPRTPSKTPAKTPSRKTPKTATRRGPVLFLPIVNRTLDALALSPFDEATAHLARQYAQRIDDARRFDEHTAEMTLSRFGPKLLAVLDRLGATPTSRSRLGGPVGPADPLPGHVQPPTSDGDDDGQDDDEAATVSWLEEMRASRAERDTRTEHG